MAAANRATLKKKKVVLINGARLWGHGLHGAYKSKGMYELARAYRISKKRGWGFTPNVEDINFEEMNQQLLDGANNLENIYKNQLHKFGIKECKGMASFIDEHTLQVGDLKIEAKNIIIASGTNPHIPPQIKCDEKLIMSPDLLIRNHKQIKSLTILGAGIIGCEFASIMNAFGVEVHLIDNKPAILNHEDDDIYGFLNMSFTLEGIHVHHSSTLKKMAVSNDGKVHSIINENETIITDAALISTGREPNTASLKLKNAGVETGKFGYIPVNAFTQTNIPNIYAVGDVSRRTTGLDMALVHIAEAEGRKAVDHICGSQQPMTMHHIPFIIFTMPMIAGAGINEKQAEERYTKPRIAIYEHVHNHRAQAMRYYEGFVKLIVGPKGDDRILGLRAIGPMADSLIGEVSVLIEHEIPYTHLLDSIHAHPSLSESLLNAARMIEGSLKF